MRESGVLMPIFSLPGKYGIGCLSKEAYKFVDFLRDGGQSYWQILPVGPTGYGDSPYQSFSTFAGNPYFISLETLIEKGLLKEEECAELEGLSETDIDYGYQYEHRYNVLRKAFARWKETKDSDFESFFEKNAFWLEDYALFMALKDHFDGVSFTKWDKDLRFREPAVIAKYKKELADEIGFYEYLQYEFAAEWFALKKYANENGVKIVGDIPIYVSPDSSDFWADPQLFVVDENRMQTEVAGCPPDGFSADGQLWGNPIYNWEAHKETGFAWWIRRMKKCTELYDVIRIDHFRGFDEFFAIKAGEPTAVNGEWKPGPGIELFDAINAEIGEMPIIAEDLGFITDSVKQLVSDTGFPNMKVLEFAFDSRDSSGANLYLPHNYDTNCVVYTGTHDNETLAGWFTSITKEDREMFLRYIDLEEETDIRKIVDRCLKIVEASVANMCIIPMQDWLGLDNSARINHPSTLGTNWRWRMKSGAYDDKLAERILRITQTYGRVRVEAEASEDAAAAGNTAENTAEE